MADIPISNDPIQNPYREFTYAIAVSGQETIYFNHSYFRVLTVSAGASVAIRFGASGGETTVIGQGIGIELPEPVKSVTLINKGAGIATVTVALAMGRISDDRLSVSATLNVNQTKASVFDTAADVAMNNGALTLLLAADTTRREAFISNLIGNAVLMRVGDASTTATRGIEVGVGGSIILNTTEAIYGWIVGAGKTVGIAFTTD